MHCKIYYQKTSAIKLHFLLPNPGGDHSLREEGDYLSREEAAHQRREGSVCWGREEAVSRPFHQGKGEAIHHWGRSSIEEVKGGGRPSIKGRGRPFNNGGHPWREGGVHRAMMEAIHQVCWGREEAIHWVCWGREEAIHPEAIHWGREERPSIERRGHPLREKAIHWERRPSIWGGKRPFVKRGSYLSTWEKAVHQLRSWTAHRCGGKEEQLGNSKINMIT